MGKMTEGRKFFTIQSNCRIFQSYFIRACTAANINISIILFSSLPFFIKEIKTQRHKNTRQLQRNCVPVSLCLSYFYFSTKKRIKNTYFADKVCSRIIFFVLSINHEFRSKGLLRLLEPELLLLQLPLLLSSNRKLCLFL